MIVFIPFTLAHLAHISDPDAAEVLASGNTALEGYPAFTGVVDGSIVGCAGIHPIWRGRWNCWAFLEPDTRPHMRRITQLVQSVIEAYPVPRIEAHVRPDFPQGIKFVKLLGFTRETPEPMQNWMPDGSAVIQFSKVR